MQVVDKAKIFIHISLQFVLREGERHRNRWGKREGWKARTRQQKKRTPGRVFVCVRVCVCKVKSRVITTERERESER